MPKQPKTAAKPAEVPLTGTEATYERALKYLDNEIERVITGKAAKTKHDPAYRVATLTRMVAQVDAERRKSRAAEMKRLEKLSRSLVMAWLRSLDVEEQKSIARELATMITQEGNILA